MAASISVLILTSPENVLNGLVSAGTNAVTLTISLLGIYALWLGILGIVEATGVSRLLAGLLSPVIDFLFGKVDPQTKGYLAMNMSANILGLGNACTPMGIKAMQGLDKLNGHSARASTAMIMLMVVNATSIQLLPTTVMGMRIAHGSAVSSDIIIPTLVATAVSTIAGVALVFLCARLFREKKKPKDPSVVIASRAPETDKRSNPLDRSQMAGSTRGIASFAGVACPSRNDRSKKFPFNTKILPLAKGVPPKAGRVVFMPDTTPGTSCHPLGSRGNFLQRLVSNNSPSSRRGGSVADGVAAAKSGAKIGAKP